MALAADSLGPTVCIGEILVEIVATTVGEGFAETQPLLGPFPSGAPAIFIDQCARMGGRAAMIGVVGEDDFGRICLDRLQRDGVDVSGCLAVPELPTGTAFVRYRQDGTRDFVFNMWTSAAGRLAWTADVEAVVAQAGHLHVMGTLLGQDIVWPLIERAAKIVKARGGTVSLDPNMRKELTADAVTGARIAKIVSMSDLLLPSGSELYLAAGVDPSAGEDMALERLFSQGVSEVAVKRGDQGASCFQPGGLRTDEAAFKVTEIDPTGAGDCFGGAYLASRRLGLTVQEALVYANAAGARNVTMRGPMEGAGMRNDLDQFIANTSRGS